MPTAETATQPNATPRSQPDVSWPVTIAGVATLAAAVLHFVLTPTHMEEARGEGLFFLSLGTAQLALALLLFREPGRLLYFGGIIVNGSAIVLWLVTRFIPSPFAAEAEAFDTIGLFTKGLELLAIVGLATAYLREGGRVPFVPKNGSVAVALAIGLAIAGAGVVYGAGIAAAAVVPALSEGETHSHGGNESEEGHAHAIIDGAEDPGAPWFAPDGSALGEGVRGAIGPSGT